MALKFQYNKTTIQDLKKQLSIRQKALPILQNKETALRKEIKQRQLQLQEMKNEWDNLIELIRSQEGLWTVFSQIVYVKKVDIQLEKVIGVKVPVVKAIDLQMSDVSWGHFPAWFPTGFNVLKKGVELTVNIDMLHEQLLILEEARKKTTQKVNLYEKVQIPEMEDAILKIKRFLEDKENIAKAAQKIMKNRNQQSMMA